MQVLISHHFLHSDLSRAFTFKNDMDSNNRLRPSPFLSLSLSIYRLLWCRRYQFIFLRYPFLSLIIIFFIFVNFLYENWLISIWLSNCNTRRKQLHRSRAGWVFIRLHRHRSAVLPAFVRQHLLASAFRATEGFLTSVGTKQQQQQQKRFS